MPELMSLSVIDDDEGVLAALEALFEASGYGVSCFTSGEDMLARGTRPYGRCIISDYHMSGMDGLELCREIRRLGLTTPFVLMTAFPTLRTHAVAAKLGISAVLEKPFEPLEILAAIERVI